LEIGNFKIGSNTFIIAELSANHGHDIEIAKKTIKAASEAGANAIKLQTYTADTMTIDCNNEFFTLNQGTIWDGRTFYDLYKEGYTPWEWHKEIKEYANTQGLIFFSTPFDKSAVDFLEELDVPAYKVASFELLDIPLIEYIAAKGKPMIMSTGIANLEEINDAIEACRRMNNNDIILLKTTSSYPAKVEDSNLKTISDMLTKFDVIVGVSDHTLGITVPIVSVSLGAKVIEKHFILDKSLGGPDVSFSLEPKEFKQMVESIRDAEKSIGKVDYSIENKEKQRLLGRSLFVVEDILPNGILTTSNIRSIRPGYGIKPKFYDKVLGMKAKSEIKRGTPLSWDLIE
jgi:pseudaminic acid synthase